MTDAVELAQRWHDDQRAMHRDAQESDVKSWQDCGVCSQMNPYFDDADREDL